METFLQDIRYSIRMLFRKRGFTAVAVLTLALGIGANSAIFTIVNAVLLRPLPYKAPDQLMMLWETQPHAIADKNNMSDAVFLDVKDRNDVFEQMAAFVSWNFNITGGSEARRVAGLRVSANIFSMLGKEAMLGRTFQPEEDTPGNANVIVISHKMWQRDFASDRNIIGRAITVDGHPTSIIGVMPAGFHFPDKEAELWKPAAFDRNEVNRDLGLYSVIARLKPGVSVEHAQSQMQAIAAQLQEQYPDDYAGRGLKIVPLYEHVVGDIRTPFLIMLGAVGFVLLIACANVANLLLARAATRSREVAIRTALGATRFRVIRQLLTESLLLAAVGGGLGVLIALWAVDFLVAFSPEEIPRIEEISTDGRALIFMVAVSLLTGLIFGIAPALQASKPDLNAALKEGGKGSSAGSGHRLRKLLVVSEVALALVLLIGSGLLIKSFVRLRSVDTGYDPNNVLSVPVWLSTERYKEPAAQAAFADQVIERLKSLPAVEAAGATLFLPLGGAEGSVSMWVEARAPAPAGEEPQAAINIVTPGYFAALGIPIIKGRDFTNQDSRDSLPVAVINESMARQLWPDADPIGKRAAPGEPEGDDSWLTIVGVVKDVKQAKPQEEAKPEMYLSYQQSPITFPLMTLVVRTASNPNNIAAGVRGEIRAIDKDLPVYDVKTMQERLSDSVATPRFQSLLLTVFAAVALLLAAVGIYGVISYSVAERTHEIGIRMALGAQQQRVLRMVLGEGLWLALIGVALGVVSAFGLTRLMQSLLYGVSPTDPLTFVGVSLLLVGVAVLAALIPARRATRVDPMVALRCE